MAHCLFWGHAVSSDLISWRHLPISLAPDELGSIWSGSCVIDMHNMSGFFEGDDGGLVAIFTHQNAQCQAQSIAFSTDGTVWQKYDGNPVLKSERADFRDPKVFWHDATASWIMIVAAGDRAQIFRSDNLKRWHWTSDFGHDRAGNWLWECPDLFALRDERNSEIWVLSCSLTGRNEDFNGDLSRCFVAYFSGAFDGFNFTSSEVKPRRLSFGPDDYASVIFAGAPNGRTVLLSWMSHWDYAAKMPTEGWQGAMTLPREVAWRNNCLMQKPTEEIKARSPNRVLDLAV